MRLLDRLVSRREQAVVVECRRCGETVDRGTVSCPVCDSTDVVTHRIR
jgi:RNA polymerase subunit RPABC4/transcription elongation factor Spt4